MDADLALALSEDQLLEQLGRELLGEGLGFGVEDPRRHRALGRRWLDARNEKIRAALCDDPAFQAVFDQPLRERLMEAGAVADALSALAGRPPVTTVAIILLRRGREAVCGEV